MHFLKQNRKKQSVCPRYPCLTLKTMYGDFRVEPVEGESYNLAGSAPLRPNGSESLR